MLRWFAGLFAVRTSSANIADSHKHARAGTFEKICCWPKAAVEIIAVINLRGYEGLISWRRTETDNAPNYQEYIRLSRLLTEFDGDFIEISPLDCLDHELLYFSRYIFKLRF